MYSINQKEKIVELYSSLLIENNYYNIKKLRALFSYWLDIYFFAVKNQIILPNNCLDLVTQIMSETPHIITKSQSTKSKSNKYLKHLIKNLLSIFPIPCGVLPGGVRSQLDRIINFITMVKLKKINHSINKQFKKKFLNRSKKYMSENFFSIFSKVLSDKFFINLIKNTRMPISYYGSGDIFHKENIVKLLFLDQNIFFTSFQHGGQDSELRINRMDEFAKEISDKYFHWGLGKRNIKQNRFKINSKPFNKINSVYIPDIFTPNLFLKEFMGGYNQMFSDCIKRRKNFIKINELGIGLILHPRIKNKSNIFKEKKLLTQFSLEEIKSTLLIFDYPAQTLMYKTIYENVPFLMYFNRDWHEWFTSGYSTFIKYLNSKQILFYWDEEILFYKYINNILRTGNMENNSNQHIRDYLKQAASVKKS